MAKTKLGARMGSDEVGAGVIVAVKGEGGGGDVLGKQAGGVKGGVFEFYPVFAWGWGG